MTRINIENYPEFTACKDTLARISYDKEHKYSMVNSQDRVVDFDMVKTTYANRMNLSEEVANSVDALMDFSDRPALVEFKNGDMKSEKQGVHLKILNSLLREAIGKHFMKKAKKEFIRFGFEKYKQLYFSNVHTYHIGEFEDVLMNNCYTFS